MDSNSDSDLASESAHKTAYSIQEATRALAEANTHTHGLTGEHPDVVVKQIKRKLRRAENMIESANDQLDAFESNADE